MSRTHQLYFYYLNGEKILAIGMPVNLSTLPPICENCITSKQTKTPVPKTRGGEQAEKKLEKVHSDITGLEDVGTHNEEKYMLNFVDDYSGMVWIYPLKKKSDAFASFQEWKALVKMKLVNTSRYAVQTMVASTHLSLFHVTCATRVSTTRPLHCIQLPKMGNLNDY